MARMRAQSLPDRLSALERRHRREVNAAYERGWSEGWDACLSRVSHDGLEKVLGREWLLPPNTLALSAPDPGAADDVDQQRDREQDQNDRE